MGENRSQARQAMMARVQVSWEDKSGRRRRVDAVIDDVSKGGFGILVTEPIPVGASLDIDSRNGQFVGTVVHCARSNGKFLLGVRREAKQSSDQGTPGQ